MINFWWIQVFLKEKNRKRLKFIESKKLCRLLLHLLFNLRPRPIDSDLRWKQEPAKKISGLHELKKAVWRILVLLFIYLLEWKPHRLRLAQLQDLSQFKPFLSQLTELSIALLMCRSHIDHWALLENISWAFFFTTGSSSETSPRLSGLCCHVLSGCFTKAGPCFQRSFRGRHVVNLYPSRCFVNRV